MVVEVMGLLIVIGVILVLIVRFQGNRQRLPERADFMDSMESLRKEMDRSSNEAIQRMGSHVNQFGRLIHEAEERAEELHRHMDELRMLQQGIQRQITEARSLQQHLSEQQRQCQQAYQQMAMQSFVRMNSTQSSMQEIPVVQPHFIEESQAVEDVEPESFSRILKDSMEREEAERWPRDVYEPSLEAKQTSVQMLSNVQGEVREIALSSGRERGDVSTEDVSARARVLLQSGRSVEEVARETGMGRGAIELLWQMIRQKDGI